MSDEWHNFMQVTCYVYHDQQLFRSSAPNYAGHDNTQRLTQTAVNFLVENGINGIISFNEFSYTPAEMEMLDKAGIIYRHLPVVDYTAPTLDQLKDAIEFFRSVPNGSILAHCGYGYGRTGTGVTALQLFATWGNNPPEQEWKTVNHVEKSEQLAVLRELRDFFIAD